MAKKKRVVAVSGGFDPLHIGHIEMMERAKKLGDELVVILNNDNWLVDKKGFAFMPEMERKKIIEALGVVDRVILTTHKPGDPDRSVRKALRKIKPDIFGNGGDRKPAGDPVPEVAVCEELDVEMVYNLGQKIQSSSELVRRAKAYQRTKKEPRKLRKPKRGI